MDPNYIKPLKAFAKLKLGKVVPTLVEGVEYEYKVKCDSFSAMFSVWNGKRWLSWEDDKMIDEYFEIIFK